MSTQGHGRPTVEILLVEDSPSDMDLIIEALKEAEVINRLSIVGDGVQAMQFLRRQPPFPQAPRPDLILLDLNLPRKDGHEVLAELKADPSLRTVPVVVFSTSREERDVVRAYELQANCYVTKPVDFSQFLRAIQTIEHFWLEIATLPGTGRDLRCADPVRSHTTLES